MEIALRYQLLLLTIVLCAACARPKTPQRAPESETDTPIPSLVGNVIVGADQLSMLILKLKDKKVALVVNHTSLSGGAHLADTLQGSGVNIVKIFAPEHGFRGTADAGEHVKDAVDVKTGLPLVSLYGS